LSGPQGNFRTGPARAPCRDLTAVAIGGPTAPSRLNTPPRRRVSAGAAPSPRRWASAPPATPPAGGLDLLVGGVGVSTLDSRWRCWPSLSSGPLTTTSSPCSRRRRLLIAPVTVNRHTLRQRSTRGPDARAPGRRVGCRPTSGRNAPPFRSRAPPSADRGHAGQWAAPGSIVHVHARPPTRGQCADAARSAVRLADPYHVQATSALRNRGAGRSSGDGVKPPPPPESTPSVTPPRWRCRPSHADGAQPGLDRPC